MNDINDNWSVDEDMKLAVENLPDNLPNDVKRRIQDALDGGEIILLDESERGEGDKNLRINTLLEGIQISAKNNNDENWKIELAKKLAA